MLGMTLRRTRDITLHSYRMWQAVFLSTGTTFEMNTDPVVVASVVCATQSVGAHISGLLNLLATLTSMPGGLTVSRVRLLVLIQGFAELGVLGVTSMNVKGIMLRSDRMCIVEVFRTDLCSGWTSLR